MNTNRNKMGGVGIYLVVIAVIAVLYFALARLSPSSSSYSYSNFLWDVQNGYVSSVLIKQNSEVPTGVLSITKTDNGEELLNVSDVHEIEQLLLDNNIRYTLKDVTRDSVWITTILPFGICLVIIIVIMMMTNRQAGGGGGAGNARGCHNGVGLTDRFGNSDAVGGVNNDITQGADAIGDFSGARDDSDATAVAVRIGDKAAPDFAAAKNHDGFALPLAIAKLGHGPEITLAGAEARFNAFDAAGVGDVHGAGFAVIFRNA